MRGVIGQHIGDLGSDDELDRIDSDHHAGHARAKAGRRGVAADAAERLVGEEGIEFGLVLRSERSLLAMTLLLARVPTVPHPGAAQPLARPVGKSRLLLSPRDDRSGKKDGCGGCSTYSNHCCHVCSSEFVLWSHGASALYRLNQAHPAERGARLWIIHFGVTNWERVGSHKFSRLISLQLPARIWFLAPRGIN